MELMQHGRVITIDVADRHEVDHPRIEFVTGSSIDPAVVEHVRRAAEEADGQ